jgi:hypothetical protein
VIQLLGPEVLGIKQHPGGVVGSIRAQGSGIAEPAIPTGLAGNLIGLFLKEWRGGAHGCPQVRKEWSSLSAEWRVGVAKGSWAGPFSVASAATTVDSDPELVGRAVAPAVLVQPPPQRLEAPEPPPMARLVFWGPPEVGARES